MRRLALIAFAAPLFLAAPLRAQQPAQAPPPAVAPMPAHAHAMGPGADMGGDMAGCKVMMAQMDSANAKLAALTETMNKASGSKKTDAMAAVVNALIQDRLAMQKQMHEMHMHMMGGMGEMGGMGGMGGMGATAGCSAGMECCKPGATGCSAPAAAPDAGKKE